MTDSTNPIFVSVELRSGLIRATLTQFQHFQIQSTFICGLRPRFICVCVTVRLVLSLEAVFCSQFVLIKPVIMFLSLFPLCFLLNHVIEITPCAPCVLCSLRIIPFQRPLKFKELLQKVMEAFGQQMDLYYTEKEVEAQSFRVLNRYGGHFCACFVWQGLEPLLGSISAHT